METIIVLAMHGAPPNDFPRREMGEFFGLHMKLERGQVPAAEREALEERYAALERKMRDWPRTEQNDPFWRASQELAERLARATGHEVIVGFNEFCAPTMDEALERAIEQGAEKVVVVTPMMTRGGEHAEKDIPDAVERVEERHPEVVFRYAWPFEIDDVAYFLADQVERYM